MVRQPLPTYPITGAEVEACFKEAAAFPPYPDAETRRQEAAIYAELRRPAPPPWTAADAKAWRKKAKRRRDAINLLLAAIREEREEVGNHVDDAVSFGTKSRGGSGTYREAFDAMQASLESARVLLCKERPHPTLKPWHIVGFIVMNLVVEILSDIRGKKVGHSRNSMAAHFTELMLRRRG